MQKQCLDVPSASKCGGQGGCTGNYRPEVIPSRLSNITLYLQALAVPARRNVNDAEVKRGEDLFAQASCSACHVSELKTGAKTAVPAAADLVIHPYTDLLLHDMGEELADGRPDYKATGREWRTPPLWGIGLLRTVNGHSDLLHDGRARDVTEAILWHGGQAEKVARGVPHDAEGGPRGAGEVRGVVVGSREAQRRGLCRSAAGCGSAPLRSPFSSHFSASATVEKTATGTPRLIATVSANSIKLPSALTST